MTAGVAGQLGEHPVAVALVERSCLEIEGVQVGGVAPPAAGLGLGGPEQGRAEALPPVARVHPEQVDVEEAACRHAGETTHELAGDARHDRQRLGVAFPHERLVEGAQAGEQRLDVGRRRAVGDLKIGHAAQAAGCDKVTERIPPPPSAISSASTSTSSRPGQACASSFLAALSAGSPK